MGDVNAANIKLLVMVASLFERNGAFNLTKLHCEFSHLLLEFHNGFISPYFMACLT